MDHILPADLVPVVSTKLPLSIGAICACSEALAQLKEANDRRTQGIEEMYVRDWKED